MEVAGVADHSTSGADLLDLTQGAAVSSIAALSMLSNTQPQRCLLLGVSMRQQLSSGGRKSLPKSRSGWLMKQNSYSTACSLGGSSVLRISLRNVRSLKASGPYAASRWSRGFGQS